MENISSNCSVLVCNLLYVDNQWGEGLRVAPYLFKRSGGGGMICQNDDSLETTYLQRWKFYLGSSNKL